MKEIKIKKLNEKAVIPFQKYSTDGAYDLVATSYEFKDGLHIYGVGFATEIPLGWRVKIRPRSSFTNTHCVLQNSEGLIDSEYRGEWSVRYRDLRYYKGTMSNNDLIANKPYIIGERIAQCNLEEITPIEWIEVDELNKTERGNGGYGSTGK